MRAAIVALLLVGCAPAVTVRAPICEPPPLPPSALVPCPPPQPLADGKMETLYLNSYIDTATIGCWADRMRNLKEQIAFRDAKVKECQEQAAKPLEWWRR